jgi:hypothetical protein
MKAKNSVFVSIALFVLLTTASFGQQVKTDYDRGVDFSQYKTYSWAKVETPDPLWVDRIKNAVNQALTAKGWTQVDSGGDVSIVAMDITQNRQSLDTFYNNFGGGWRWGGFGESTTNVNTYQVGSLVLDMFDSKTKKLIWRGSATDTLSDKTEKNIKNLDKGVQKMFKDFPPKAAKS